MENRTIVILSTLMLVTSFAIGRWSAPERVKIETHTVEVEKKTDSSQSASDRDRKRETTKTEVTRPDGTVEKTEKTVETTETHKETDRRDTSESARSNETSKEVTHASAKVTIAALAGVRLSSLTTASPVLYGAQVYRPVLGPIGIGVWGFTDLSFGVSLGISL